MNRSALVAVILAGASIPALALASPFDGTWKLDTARSKFTGDTMTYAKTPAGYRESSGSMSFAFAVDGKDYPTLPSRTVAWSRAVGGGWDIVDKAGGKVVTRAHRTVSADGKTLTSTYTEYRPDGTTVHESDVYARVSGAKGLAGEWRDTKVRSASDTIRITTSSGGHFELFRPAFKETVSGRTDGSASAMEGPAVPSGLVAAFKAEGPRTWSDAVSLGGKTYGEGVMTVSADGKTLTDTRWATGKKSEASVSVYIRQ